jgi:hypothetical protein
MTDKDPFSFLALLINGNLNQVLKMFSMAFAEFFISPSLM